MLDEHLDLVLTIHLVLDNVSSHTSKDKMIWLATRPRLRTCHTPPHVSWLDQAELFFSILTLRLLL